MILLPSASSPPTDETSSSRTQIRERVFVRGDRAVKPLLAALVTNQKNFPGTIPLLCIFHADALVRSVGGKQVALCFHCHEAAVTASGKDASFSFEQTPAVGGWSMASKPIAAELTRLFPGETFPR